MATMMPTCRPEIASRCAVPVLAKASCSDSGMLSLTPSNMPCASEACGSGRAPAREADRPCLSE